MAQLTQHLSAPALSLPVLAALPAPAVQHPHFRGDFNLLTEALSRLECPIAMDAFGDTAASCSDGHTYSDDPRTLGLQTGISPLTREQLNPRAYPHLLMRSIMRELVDTVNAADEFSPRAIAEHINSLPADHRLFASCVCPLTRKAFVDPLVAADGHTYERSAIEERLSSGNWRSPITGERLTSRNLYATREIKNLVDGLRAWVQDGTPPLHEIMVDETPDAPRMEMFYAAPMASCAVGGGGWPPRDWPPMAPPLDLTIERFLAPIERERSLLSDFRFELTRPLLDPEVTARITEALGARIQELALAQVFRPETFRERQVRRARNLWNRFFGR